MCRSLRYSALSEKKNLFVCIEGHVTEGGMQPVIQFSVRSQRAIIILMMCEVCSGFMANSKEGSYKMMPVVHCRPAVVFIFT